MSQENNTQLERAKKDISAQVLERVDAFQSAGELRIPQDYSPENALKSAYLILSEQKNTQGKAVLEVCTKESIANALLKMVVWGLSPMKKQCDFIPYGDKLDCSIEYAGNVVLAKRFGNLKDIKARAVFKGDSFVFEVDPESGRTKIKEHKQTLESMGSKDVIGAYAMIEMNDGVRDVEIMSIQQIRDSWNQGAMKGNSPAHKNFPDQMAMKTVINRACKMLIRSSDDAVLFTGEIDKEESQADRVASDVQNDIKQNANKEELGFKDISDAVEYEEVADTPEVKTSDSKEKEPAEADGPGF